MSAALALTVAFALAAPVPGVDEKPRPRPKLLGTLYLDAWVQATHWTPDGKHLVLLTESKVMVYPRDALTPTAKTYPGEMVKPLTWFDRPDVDAVRANGRLTPAVQIGTTADGGVWAVVPAGEKLNAETRLVVWDAKTVLAGGENPKPDRDVSLEVDNPLSVVLSADGQDLFAATEWKSFAPTLVRLSARTGDLKRGVPLAGFTDHPCGGCGFDPSTGRTFLALHAGGELWVECRAADGGKAVWGRAIPCKPVTEQPAALTLSPNGEWVAVAQPIVVTAQQPARGRGERPRADDEPASELVLLDAKTGKPGPELVKPDGHTAQAYGFSADGRLLFGRVESHGGQETRKMVVWDTRTGAEVKGWARRHPVAAAAFAPSGHDLLIVEQVSGRVLLGVWDLSPLVK